MLTFPASLAAKGDDEIRSGRDVGEVWQGWGRGGGKVGFLRNPVL